MRLISTEYPYFPASPHAGNAAVLVVLVQDGQAKYRAYTGLARYPDDKLTHEQRIEDARWVANSGRSLTYAEAIPKYFVGIKPEQWSAL